MRFGSRGPSEFANEIAWEDAVQGLGMAMSIVASEKNREISACCFTSVSKLRPPENYKYYSPARSHTFVMDKSSSPRDRRKWSLGLG